MCVPSGMSVDLSLSELAPDHIVSPDVHDGAGCTKLVASESVIKLEGSGGPHDGTHGVPTKVKHGKGEDEHPGV